MYRFACLIQVGVAIGYSLQILYTRQMKALHFTVIQFNYFLISTNVESFLLLPPIHSQRPALIYSDPKPVFVLLGIMGLSYYFRNFFYTLASQNSNPVMVSMFIN
jgi:hypothetical protein